MCITEYNEAETMQMFKEEGREEGEERRLLESNIKWFCDVAAEYAPDYDEAEVLKSVDSLRYEPSNR